MPHNINVSKFKNKYDQSIGHVRIPMQIQNFRSTALTNAELWLLKVSNISTGSNMKIQNFLIFVADLDRALKVMQNWYK